MLTTLHYQQIQKQREMSQTVKFFNTEIDLHRSKKQQTGSASFSALNKVKQLKQHVKKLEGVYTKALSQKIRTQKSINQLHKSAQKVRIDFLKFYENKKAKLLNKQKVQNYLASSKQHSSAVYRKTKQRKLLDEYQMLTTKNEEQQSNLIKQQQNRKQREKLQKEIKVKNLEAFMYAKEQYHKIKEEKLSLAERNKKISEMLEMRCHINYTEKMERELAYIRCYEELLKEAEENHQIMQEIRPSTTASKSFFITTRRINSTRQSRDARTSHTAR